MLDANRAASGGSAWDGKASLRLEFAYVGQGLTGTTTSLDDLNAGYWLDTFALGPATGANGFDGTHTWSKDPSGTITLQDGGEQLPLAINEGYRRANLAWRADRGGAAIVSDGEKTDGGASYDVLTITPKGGKNFDVWLDSRTHLLSRIVEVQGPQTMTSTLSDYRLVDGVELPFKETTTNGDPKYDQTTTVTSAVFLPAQPQSAYSAPKVTIADISICRRREGNDVSVQTDQQSYLRRCERDGKGPYQFIFDTGGVNMLTNSHRQ